MQTVADHKVKPSLDVVKAKGQELQVKCGKSFASYRSCIQVRLNTSLSSLAMLNTPILTRTSWTSEASPNSSTTLEMKTLFPFLRLFNPLAISQAATGGQVQARLDFGPSD
jgi:hypothetical protein